MNQDLKHLKLLSIFHYVMVGIIIILSLFPAYVLIPGLVIMIVERAEGHGVHPAIVTGMIVIPSILILVGLGLAICALLAGHYLRGQRHYSFCKVVAVIECLLIPFGAILGVFTIIILMKEPVKKLFEVNHYDGPTSPPPLK